MAGDSVTNWLQACAADAECHGDARCIGSVCTTSCSATNVRECAPLGAAALCESGSGVCDLPCATHETCHSLGAIYRCERERCRAPAADVLGPRVDAAQVIETLEDASSVADSASDADAASAADAMSVADAAPNVDAASLFDAGPSWRLGMNDVTILTPLPADYRTPVLLGATDVGQDGAALVPKDLFDRLARSCFASSSSSECRGDQEVLLPDDYQNLHLVALRFDLCDHNVPETCAPGADASLRLVWQPVRGERFFHDAALHAFFSIPNTRLPAALATLRELAQLQRMPVASALAVSPGLSDPQKPAYAEGLRAFVRAYAERTRLVRLSVNANPVYFQEIRWLMRGLERRTDGTFGDSVIPGSTTVRQEVFLRDQGFAVQPSVDLPAGMAGVVSSTTFSLESIAERDAMVEALVASEHPLKVALDTAPCVACHVSTQLLAVRAPQLEPPRLPGAYVTSHNVTVDADPQKFGFSLRALGYDGQMPVISRRVAHETAQVLTEIERMFP